MEKVKIIIKQTATGEFTVKINSSSSDAFANTIEWLKMVIDKNDRRYDPSEKLWYISDSQSVREWLTHVEFNYDLICDFNDHAAPNQSYPASTLDAFKKLCITPDAPLEVVKAAYKALCKLHHPDIAGEENHALMVELNQAFEEIIHSR